MNFDEAIERIGKARSPQEIQRIINSTNAADRDAVQDYVNSRGDINVI